MGIKFHDGKVTIVNYGARLSEEEVDMIKKNYDIREVGELLYRCKGFGESEKPWYLQCVDWVKLIPESLMQDGNYAIRLPVIMPGQIFIYMMAECYSRSNRLPKIIEDRDGFFFRIVDLEYEVNFSRSKRRSS